MGKFTPKGPPPSPEVQRLLAPFVNLSALASTLMMGLFGLLFILPIAYAERQGWTGGGITTGLVAITLPALVFLFFSSRSGVRMQVRPLGQVSTALRERFPDAGPPRVRGRLRKGWGASVEFSLGAESAGGASAGDAPPDIVRVVAARGPRARPDLYLVRGEREYRFRDVRNPLPEMADALGGVGLSVGSKPSPS